MEINKNIEIFLDALQTLEEGLQLFAEYEHIFAQQNSEKNRQFFTTTRDSLIQRFEYCTDLFWKFTRSYLVEVEKMDVPMQSPRGIIRQAVKAGVFSEKESDQCMDMVEARNKTSHTYHEPMANEIAHEVQTYYELIKAMIERMQNNIEKK